MKNTTLCYIENPQGEYLMLHRIKKENDLNRDKWIGVGGKCEEDESPEECVCRETLEETGLTLTDYRYRGLVTFVSDRWEGEYMHLFTATGWTGTVQECNEGVLEWLHKDALAALPQWAGDKIFLDLIRRPDTPFFSLKLQYQGEVLVYAALDGKELARQGLAVPVCPEQLGGLPTPRAPSERQGERVVSSLGADVTAQYRRGAEETLRLAELYGCTTAVLKERSPSCGSGAIYDGTFTGTVTEGWGTAAALLRRHGVRVLGESQLASLLEELGSTQ